MAEGQESGGSTGVRILQCLDWQGAAAKWRWRLLALGHGRKVIQGAVKNGYGIMFILVVTLPLAERVEVTLWLGKVAGRQVLRCVLKETCPLSPGATRMCGKQQHLLFFWSVRLAFGANMGRNELVRKVLGWDSCTEDISFTSKTTGIWRDVEKCKERERAAARDVLPWHVGVRQQRGACLAALRPGSPHLGPGLLLSLLITSSGLEILVIACKLPNGGSCGAVRRLVLRPVCLPSSGDPEPAD